MEKPICQNCGMESIKVFECKVCGRMLCDDCNSFDFFICNNCAKGETPYYHSLKLGELKESLNGSMAGQIIPDKPIEFSKVKVLTRLIELPIDSKLNFWGMVDDARDSMYDEIKKLTVFAEDIHIKKKKYSSTIFGIRHCKLEWRVEYR